MKSKMEQFMYKRFPLYMGPFFPIPLNPVFLNPVSLNPEPRPLTPSP
jgi:hypothetical protein